MIPVGTDQFLNQKINIDIWLRNHWFCNSNQKSTTIQPKINHLSTKFQPFFNFDISTSNLVNFWLNWGWLAVFLVDHCYKMNDVSIKYQCWREDGWGKSRLKVKSTLILMLRGWSVSILHVCMYVGGGGCVWVYVYMKYVYNLWSVLQNQLLYPYILMYFHGT